jgi:hypothetical protein
LEAFTTHKIPHIYTSGDVKTPILYWKIIAASCGGNISSPTWPNFAVKVNAETVKRRGS